jgi:hypothetical protein
MRKASNLWNKPNERYDDARYNEEKSQWNPPGAVIIYLTSAIAHPTNHHPSKLAVFISVLSDCHLAKANTHSNGQLISPYHEATDLSWSNLGLEHWHHGELHANIDI